ncbi:MAG: filamentous hemagglutinin N-terminal domain-containing protein [Oscillatoriales cyanobacterium RM2_1_1]|nr:filamentous hemagglutinin N-terminal domain-containing protein [Oscillatoriales cyanobacterium SM2_3_0]NJO45963.1 filamentous hemagglutinin N-terminal domain-containing protein [Oscillatoriales cyanobacterium RM2_1_1]
MLKLDIQQLPWLLLLTMVTNLWDIPGAQAQIIPDNTLGREASTVTPNVNIQGINSHRIDGGAVRGSSLFHSFQEFNINANQGAYFSNPAGITNILSRITGENASNILGTLGVLGNANLFLMNPNGIIFGPDARLDIGGSFFATTADGILFDNGFEFTASNPQSPTLLTINIPIGLSFRDNPGPIGVNGVGNQRTITSETKLPTGENEPPGLQVPDGQTLGLIGGDLDFNSGVLTADQGQIALGSVGPNSRVGLTQQNSSYLPQYDQVKAFGNIQMNDLSFVTVQGEGGGSIQVFARNLTLTENSEISANTLGSQPGGRIEVQAESITLARGIIRANSGLDQNKTATGTGGNITITAQTLQILDGGFVAAATHSQGNGGNVTIRAAEIDIRGQVTNNRRSGLFTSVLRGSTGNAGNLEIEAQRLRVSNSGSIAAATFGNGNAGNVNVRSTESIEVLDEGAIRSVIARNAVGNGGNVTLETGKLRIANGSFVSATTIGSGNAGNVNITAQDIQVTNTVSPEEVSFRGGILAQINESAQGNAGTITLNTQRLSIQGGAVVSAPLLGAGRGGNIVINAQQIEVSGTRVDGSTPSLLFAGVGDQAVGEGGTLTLNTQDLIIQGGGVVSTNTSGDGRGGVLTVKASQIEVVGRSSDGELSSRLSAASSGPQNAGSLTITTDQLTVRDGADITVSSQGEANAGQLTIRSGTILVDNGQIVAQTQLGSGGEVNLFVSDTLTLTHGATISATTQDGIGGILTLNADNTVTLNGGSQITSSVTGTGTAGTLVLNTNQLQLSDRSGLNVSSLDTGTAGNLLVDATAIQLNRSTLSANTAQGNQGNIGLNARDIRLRDNSAITTDATGEATGGNILIQTDILVALENSDISANAQQGIGGQVMIDANAVFGTAFRPQPTTNSDITATSELGGQSSGIVVLNTDADPDQNFIGFPQEVVDPAALIAKNPCQQGADNEFIATGHGGLPPIPTQEVHLRRVSVGLAQPVAQTITQPPLTAGQRSSANRPIPARGWIRNSQGKVILVSYDPGQTNPRGSGPFLFLCPQAPGASNL